MSHRGTSIGLVPAALVIGISLTTASAAGQAQAPAARAESPLRMTPWGHPNLQGVWTNKTITPLERPDEFAGRAFLTDAEAARLEADVAADRVDRPPNAGSPGTYNQFWWDRGTRVVPSRRTSLVIDPSDGRLPPLTPEGQRRAAVPRIQGADGPEDRHFYERCIIRHSLPSSMSPTAYNSNYQIFQTPDYVAIYIEMVPHTRIIPLDGRPHVHQAIRQWKGDSRGRWEGDTLVVETTNVTGKTNYFGSSEHLHFVERFRRVSEDVIDYQFTVTDPTTFTRPWTAAIPLIREAGRVYEYACHEGNYGMVNLLAGARAEERSAGVAAESRR